jgi:OFA family oxalate/formate antiporter-like MFS transporter
MGQSSAVPFRAWVVTFAGTAVNLCLGILYAWSVWKSKLIAGAQHVAEAPMSGRDEGWSYFIDEWH